MKNIFKYTLAALFGVLSFASCTNDFEYEGADPNNLGGNGYVESTKAGTTFMFVPGQTQDVQFVVGRINAEEEGTVSLTSNSDKLSVPATVQFAKGEKSKTITATANIATGATEKIVVSVAEGDAYLYAQSEITFTIQVFPVIDVQYLFGAFTEDILPWQLYDLGDGQYRIPAGDYDYDIDFTIDSKNRIIVKPQAAWVHQDYGDVYIMGNAAGDAKADGSGSGVAGMYDPATGIAQMALYHFVPGVGSFGTFMDIVIFPKANN